jgi:hypothetical protein
VYEVETSDDKPVIQYSTADECNGRTCIVSGRVSLSGATPVRLYEKSIGSSAWDYSYGAVGLDASGDVFEAYSRSNATTTPGAAVMGPGFNLTLQPAVAGTTACPSTQTPPCDERWGDYLDAAIDPSEPSTVWVSGLYQQSSGGFGWSTIIAQVSTATRALPTVTSVAPTSGPAAGKAKITVTGSGFEAGGVPDVTAVAFRGAGGVRLLGTTVTVTSNTSLTVVTPSATGVAAGGNLTTDVQVTAGGLDSIVNVHDHYTFVTPVPAIHAVTFTGSSAAPTITIAGVDLTPKSADSVPCGDTSGDGFDFGSSGLFVEDTTTTFTAGQNGDCVGLVVSSYTGTKVVVTLGNQYVIGGYRAFATGDSYTVEVRGATFSGTVTYS